LEGGLIAMSAGERRRLEVLSRVRDSTTKLTEASVLLNLSYRQTCRVWKRYKEEGDRGLVHRSRGQPSNRRKPAKEKESILAIYREQYPGFGPTLASEKLWERNGHLIDHETLRRWLIEADVWKRQRKAPRHRQQRDKKAHFGELVQMDGSHHQWFTGSEEKACLMDLVDDATGTTMARMSKEETTIAAMEALWAWINRYGIPKALYVDWKNVYLTKREPTLEEQLSGELPLTQFGKACKKLAIEIIGASSPQAKGRVERKHGVYQDRAVKEFWLRGIRSIEEANQFLPEFVESLNHKFSLEPMNSADFHRPVPEGLDLKTVFCLEETRTVTNNWVIRYNNRFFQILPQSNLPPAKKKVTLQEYLDGSLHMVYRGNKVEFTEITSCTAKEVPMTHSTSVATKKQGAGEDHPWRRFNPYFFGNKQPILT